MIPLTDDEAALLVFDTKGAAVAQLLGHSLALERWREMRAATPSAILTAVGVR